MPKRLTRSDAAAEVVFERTERRDLIFAGRLLFADILPLELFQDFGMANEVGPFPLLASLGVTERHGRQAGALLLGELTIGEI